MGLRLEDSTELYQKMVRKWVKFGCWWDSMGNECLESCADSIFSAVE